MSLRPALLVLIGLLLLLAAADMVWLYPKLPERMATHFGTGGEANGWASKAGFILTQSIILGTAAMILTGLGFLLPLLPSGIINIPNRDYWLAPPRREATLQALSKFLLILGVITLAFLIGLTHLMMTANLQPKPRLGAGFWVILGLQITGTLGTVLWLYRRFRR